jgi:cell wall-associated NlpC family hydrolase
LSAAAERRAVIAEARSWEGTPFHHMGRIKGPQGGCDCATSIAAIYHAALPHRVPEMVFGYYAPGWNLSRAGAAAERYLATVQAIPGVREVALPLPGDLVLFHWGLAWAHGAVVVAWPLILHADMSAGKVRGDRADLGRLKRRRVRFFSFWSAP